VSSNLTSIHPPKAPLAFRVGVVGHRPDRLKHADLGMLSSVMRSVLQVIKDAVGDFPNFEPGLYDSPAPVLRAVSPLAEGSDRLFAKAAIDLGFELCCPFPFDEDEYQKDFTPGKALEPDSLAHFDQVQEYARTESALRIFEMDGDPNDRNTAYGACGEVVLNQSDVLVVVWDQVRLGKRGGTEETFDLATKKGVPIVVIDANAPHSWTIYQKANSNALHLRQIVHSLLRLPLADTDEGSWALRRYYRERRPRGKRLFGFTWKLFRAVFGFQRRSIRSRERSAGKKDTPVGTDWIDALATHFANTYRSAFLIAYALAIVAVALAVAPIARGWLIAGAHERESQVAILEALVILMILFLWIRGRRRHWHERWLDYRLGAELFRHLGMTSTLGSERPFPQLAAHLAKYGQPGATWPAWYVRAFERQQGLPNARVDHPYLVARLRALEHFVDEQIEYHEDTGTRYDNIEHRLHLAGLMFLILTFAAASVHGLGGYVHWLPHSPNIGGWLIFAGALFPAIGASLAGINNQGEFRRIAKRSEAMVGHLKELRVNLSNMEAAGHLRWESVTKVTAQTSQLMVNEVLDWRVVFLDRPVNPPS